MLRFSTKALLVMFAVAAVWMSTFAGFSAATDLRHCLLFVALVAAATLAFTNNGRRRAFWSAFTAAMLLCGGLNFNQPLERYTPNFMWSQMLGMSFQPVPTPIYSAPVTATPYTASGTVVLTQPQVTGTWTASPPTAYYSPAPAPAYAGPAFSYPRLWLAVSETLTALWIFLFAAICGFVAAYVYSRTERPAAAPSSAARRIVEQELRA